MATCPLIKSAILNAIISHQGVLTAKVSIENLTVPIDALSSCTKEGCAFWNHDQNACGQSVHPIPNQKA